MFMNEHDVEDMQRMIDVTETPNLAEAAWVLGNLVDWTNRNSDGWPYWRKPQQAAKRLTDMLHDREYAIRFGHSREGKPLEDVTRRDLTVAYAPIKRFFTTQGVDSAVVFAR